jgi:hypothetical protein
MYWKLNTDYPLAVISAQAGIPFPHAWGKVGWGNTVHALREDYNLGSRLRWNDDGGHSNVKPVCENL